MLNRRIAQLVPPRTRWILRKVVRTARHLPADLADALLGRRDPLTPPRRKVFVGGVNFRAGGEALCDQLVELGGLKPNHVVLDIGCGIGRAAVPLTEYLSEDGEYYGFDIVSEGIDWCADSITPSFPNFHFELADIYNQIYNQGGQYKANEYRFPHPDGSFDFVFSTSVFTHMLPGDVWNYIAETARVLKPGGTSFSSFFLLNEESLSLIQAGRGTVGLRDRMGDNMVANAREPEQAIAYEEEIIREVMDGQGLEIVEPIHYGSWCGRETYTDYQDIIVATRAD
jgi:ubiquinone/menaquinone biosynthesis C-methylase UbiE